MKRNVVRLLGLLLCVLMTGGIFASCNKRETPSPEPKTEGTKVTEAGKTPSKTTERPGETTKKPEGTTKKPEETSGKPEKPEKPTTEGLIYKLLSNGTYEVVGVQSRDLTEVVIPSTYNGKAVTSIGKRIPLVYWLDEHYHTEQRDKHRRRCILRLHGLDKHYDTGQRDEYRIWDILPLHRFDEYHDTEQCDEHQLFCVLRLQ